MRTPALYMAPLCGKLLTPEDRKVWQQAISLLMGLKIRNGFGEEDLTAAVGTALHIRATRPSAYCVDCGVKVAREAANSGGRKRKRKQGGPTLS